MSAADPLTGNASELESARQKSRPNWCWYTYVVSLMWWLLLTFAFATLLHRDIDLLSALLGAVIPVAFWWLTWANRHEKLGKFNDYSQRAADEASAARAQKEAERKNALLTWASRALLALTPEGVVLKSHESCYWYEPATLCVIKNSTRRVGGYGGFSARIPGMHGLRFNTGKFGSRSISKSVMASTKGALAVTNRRIIFIGPEGAKVLPLSKVVGLHPYFDGVRIDVENSSPLVFVTGNEYTSLAIQRIINNATAAVPESAVNLDET